MKISVIIPHFRGDTYLKDCLESIRAQEYHSFDEKKDEAEVLYFEPCEPLEERPEVEVLIVKDGCGDDAEKVSAEFPELDIKIFSTGAKEGNPKGVAAARNIGLKMMSGDFVFFLDSDDYLSAEAFEGKSRHDGKADSEKNMVQT